MLCGYYVWSRWAEFAFLATVSLSHILAAGCPTLLSFVVNAYQLGLFLGKFRVRAGRVELMALTMAMILGNLVLPLRGGSGGMAVYLKRVHKLDFHLFAAIYGGSAILVALINCGLALVGLVALWLWYGFSHAPLSVLVSGTFLCCLVLCVYPLPVGRKGTGLAGFVAGGVRSWHELTRDKRLLAHLAASHLGLAFLLAGSFFLIYRALGHPLSWGAVLVTSSLGSIAALVPITPGSLGVFDAVVIQIPQLFGLDPPRALTAALVFRAICMVWASVLGLPGLWWLVRRGGRART
ncbi:MAG: lysylphosphatidylglycerol synthase transmembrane domain-containing protein [Thermodesulfobacteriota bacterium]